MHYRAARGDAMSAKVKRLAVWGAVGLIGLFAGIAAVVVAVYLALDGIALGLAALFGRPWVGELVTGLGVLLLAGLGLWIGLRYWMNLSLRTAKEKYERRRNLERRRFGKDVAQRAS
jgi:hypothetical protein